MSDVLSGDSVELGVSDDASLDSLGVSLALDAWLELECGYP